MPKNLNILNYIFKVFTSSEEPEDPEISKLIDVKNLRVLGIGSEPSCCSVDTKMEIFVVGFRDGTIKLFNKQGQCINHTHCLNSSIIAVELIENAGLLVYAARDNSISLLDFSNNHFAAVGQHKLRYEHFTCMRVCQKTRWIYVGTSRGSVYTLMREDVSHVSNKISYEDIEDGVSSKVVGVDICPRDCARILIGFRNGLVVLWSLKRRGPKLKINIQAGMSDLRFMADKLCVCVEDCGIITTDFLKVNRIEKIKGKIVSAFNGTVVIAKGDFVHVLGKGAVQLKSPFVAGCQLSKNKLVLLSQNDVRLLDVRDLSNLTFFWDFSRFKTPTCLEYMSSKELVITGYSDGSLKLWDLSNGVRLKQSVEWGKLFMDCKGTADPSVRQLFVRENSILCLTLFTVVLFSHFSEESVSIPVVELNQGEFDIMYIGDVPSTWGKGFRPVLSVLSKSGDIVTANYNEKIILVATSCGDLNVISITESKLVCHISFGDPLSALHFYNDFHIVALSRGAVISFKLGDLWECSHSSVNNGGHKFTGFFTFKTDQRDIAVVWTDCTLATYFLEEEGKQLRMEKIEQRELKDIGKVTPIFQPHLLLACEMLGGVVIFYSLPDLRRSQKFDLPQDCGQELKFWTNSGIGFARRRDGIFQIFSFLKDFCSSGNESFYNPVPESPARISQTFMGRFRGSGVNEKILASPVSSGTSVLQETVDNLNLRGDKLNLLVERAEGLANRAKMFADLSKQLCDKYEKS